MLIYILPLQTKQTNDFMGFMSINYTFSTSKKFFNTFLIVVLLTLLLVLLISVSL